MSLKVMRYHRPAGVTGPDTSPDYKADALHAERWEFRLYSPFGDGEVILRCESYSRLARPTRRHGWRDEKPGVRGSFWSRIDERLSGIKRGDIPFPEDVVAEAKAAVVITFKAPGESTL